MAANSQSGVLKLTCMIVLQFRHFPLNVILFNLKKKGKKHTPVFRYSLSADVSQKDASRQHLLIADDARVTKAMASSRWERGMAREQHRLWEQANVGL